MTGALSPTTTSGEAPVFEARGLTKRFGRLTALSGLDLRVDSGQVLGLFGRNGAGKTTFLHLAASLTRPTAGEILYVGRPATDRAHVGLLSHASFLYPDLSPRENLDFYGRLYGIRDKSRIDGALERADLTRRADAPLRTLSRGMQQRLAIARALLHEPKLLLLDEPYTGLDALSAERLSRQIDAFRGAETAVILTTHDLERGLELSTRVAILEGGRLAYEGDPEEPVAFRKRFAAIVTE